MQRHAGAHAPAAQTLLMLSRQDRMFASPSAPIRFAAEVPRSCASWRRLIRALRTAGTVAGKTGMTATATAPAITLDLITLSKIIRIQPSCRWMHGKARQITAPDKPACAPIWQSHRNNWVGEAFGNASAAFFDPAL